MAEDLVLYEERDGAALVTMNRPDKINAWTVPLYRALVAAIETANESSKVGAIVLAGAGKGYCSGIDFKAPPEPADEKGRIPNVASLAMAQDTSWLHLMTHSKPVVVAAHGPVIGIGVTHILSADIRIAGESAIFSFPFLKLGTMPEMGATALLPRLVGYGRALDLCLSASKVDAREALRIGLVTRVVPDAELVDEAIRLAAELSAFPALQVKLTKQMFDENYGETDLNALLAREGRAFIAMFKAQKAAKKRPID